ncbi:MAG TPA: hypothetical protein VFS05_07035 [Gemmatimonadaceae bacterium]|nr:hypothetical protein [Gemmatimonadaceae bacterium]
MLVRAPSCGIAIAAIALLACRSGDGSRRAAADSAAPAAKAQLAYSAAAPNVVTITAKDYAFDAPAEIPAGPTTFRLENRGPSLHHMQLIRLEQGKTAADFIAALKAGGPPPRWATMVGGPNPREVGTEANATLDLAPGNYVVVCFIPDSAGVPHVMHGMVRPLTVTGTMPASVAEPTADVNMALVDYGFELSKPITAGRHTIRVDDKGQQPHEVVVIRLKPGKTPEDFAAWAEHPRGPSPATLEGGVSGIMPGTHAYFTTDFEPGEYALICFIPDMKDGKPHIAHGMVKRFTVS